jgi:putative ABC transport system ATP-binding protein
VHFDSPACRSHCRTPAQGTIRLFGRDTRSLRRVEKARLRGLSIGFVFQSYNLTPTLTALRNVSLPLEYARVPREERRCRSLQALEAVGLKDRAEHYPGELSGGQEQRVAIARSLVIDPQVILADEPTGNLDSEATESLMQQFTSLSAEGKTILTVTHDPVVASYADRILTLNDGCIVSDKRV